MCEKCLEISYECLSSIGNSFELESMMSEVVVTFYQVTKAEFVAYYADETSEALISAGKDTKDVAHPDKTKCSKHSIDTFDIVILPLKNGYMKFVYVQRDDIEGIYEMICALARKINFALSACAGVKELEELNESLEDKVNAAVKKVREHEHMLLIQSKNAIMGEMLEMIAHQWRQPITSIGMISNNILFNILLCEEDGDLDIELLKTDMDDINKQIQYLSHTIDDFRGFFKESKSKETVSVQKLLKKSVSLISKQLSQESVELHVEDFTRDAEIYTYKNELIQVLLNLLHNSIDAFESKRLKDKKILLESFIEDKKLILKIKDNAGGIGEELLEKIFEPYFSTKKSKNGTGLGLYMSKTIIQKHLGGEISAKNEDGGALFSISLPIES